MKEKLETGGRESEGRKREIKELLESSLSHETIQIADKASAYLKKWVEHTRTFDFVGTYKNVGKEILNERISRFREFEKAYIEEDVFYANVEEFVDAIKKLPVAREMEEFTTSRRVTPSYNHYCSIFPYDVHELEEWEDKKTGEKVENKLLDHHKKERNRFLDYCKKQGGTTLFRRFPFPYEEPSPHPVVNPSINLSEFDNKPRETELKLNPLLFEEGDMRTKLALKILDEVLSEPREFYAILPLSEGENHVSALNKSTQLGTTITKDILDGGSFTDVLTERLAYVSDRWNGLGEEDRKAWVEGEFTHSEQAKEGRYDVVRLAAENQYVG